MLQGAQEHGTTQGSCGRPKSTLLDPRHEDWPVAGGKHAPAQTNSHQEAKDASDNEYERYCSREEPLDHAEAALRVAGVAAQSREEQCHYSVAEGRVHLHCGLGRLG